MNYDLEEELDKCATMEDLTGQNGLIQKLIGGMVEKMLEKEMEGHLGYEKHAIKGNNTGNNRNGKNKKIFAYHFFEPKRASFGVKSQS